MAKQPIPARAPVGDAFAGVVLAVGLARLLALAPADGASVVVSGALTVRYGIRFLGKPQLSIVPGLVALDYGDMLVGDEAWDFVTRRSNRYPRAEVFGFRNDGVDEMKYVKLLDLALPVEVLVYADAQATKPVAAPSAVIALPTAALPPRVLDYLPRFDTLAAWRAANAE